MESWLMLTWTNINIYTMSVNCSLPRHVMALTQLMTSVQSSSHNFPWCWRIQILTAKKAPETETRHQVTTDISGPLFSAGLLTQESMEDIWSGFEADLGQGSSFMSSAVVDVYAYVGGIFPFS
jgi:hypothetical protein